MLIRESISGYKHFGLGNIKLAFTQVCEEENIHFSSLGRLPDISSGEV